MHAVKQAHILSVCDFHSSVQATNILQHGRQSHAKCKKSKHEDDPRNCSTKRERLLEDNREYDEKLHALTQDTYYDLAT